MKPSFYNIELVHLTRHKICNCSCNSWHIYTHEIAPHGI